MAAAALGCPAPTHLRSAIPTFGSHVGCVHLNNREAELARLSGSAAPQTPADFERLVLASPNSSFVWIKYMAHHIQLGDMDSARKVAQRAIDSINYR
jgi:hypothetical protein